MLRMPRGQGLIFDELGTLRTDDGLEMPRDSLGVLAFLGAMSVLMMQPRVAEPRRLDARTGRGIAPTTRTDDEVTIIDLRPMRQETTPRDPDDEGDPGRYRHRWIVRGHWAMQPYGPSNALRKVIWRESYIKGPAGAPLLTSEKVMVWRR